MTGMELKLRRVERRVKVVELARHMGVTHPRVSQLEALAVVTPAAVEKYLAALATYPVVDTA